MVDCWFVSPIKGVIFSSKCIVKCLAVAGSAQTRWGAYSAPQIPWLDYRVWPRGEGSDGKGKEVRARDTPTFENIAATVTRIPAKNNTHLRQCCIFCASDKNCQLSWPFPALRDLPHWRISRTEGSQGSQIILLSWDQPFAGTHRVMHLEETSPNSNNNDNTNRSLRPGFRDLRFNNVKYIHRVHV